MCPASLPLSLQSLFKAFCPTGSPAPSPGFSIVVSSFICALCNFSSYLALALGAPTLERTLLELTSILRSKNNGLCTSICQPKSSDSPREQSPKSKDGLSPFMRQTLGVSGLFQKPFRIGTQFLPVLACIQDLDAMVQDFLDICDMCYSFTPHLSLIRAGIHSFKLPHDPENILTGDNTMVN